MADDKQWHKQFMQSREELEGMSQEQIRDLSKNLMKVLQEKNCIDMDAYVAKREELKATLNKALDMIVKDADMMNLAMVGMAPKGTMEQQMIIGNITLNIMDQANNLRSQINQTSVGMMIWAGIYAKQIELADLEDAVHCDDAS
jgi:hypothetical protein